MEEGKTRKTSHRPGMGKILGGLILTDERFIKQIPFIIFLAVLGIIAITNRNWSEKTIRKMEVLKDSVIELKTRSITYSSKLMDASRPSEIYDRTKRAGLGLEEQINPPRRIVVRK